MVGWLPFLITIGIIVIIGALAAIYDAIQRATKVSERQIEILKEIRTALTEISRRVFHLDERFYAEEVAEERGKKRIVEIDRSLQSKFFK